MCQGKSSSSSSSSSKQRAAPAKAGTAHVESRHAVTVMVTAEAGVIWYDV
jgi:hypothetical protein